MVWTPVDRLVPPYNQARLRKACQQGDLRTIKQLLHRYHWTWLDRMVQLLFGWFLCFFKTPGEGKVVDLEFVYDDNDGCMPIHYIVSGPPPTSFIRYLANVQVRHRPTQPAKYDAQRATVLVWLLRNGFKLNLNALNARAETPLHLALLTKSAAVTKVLLEGCLAFVPNPKDRPSISVQDGEGRTPLFVALQQHQWPAVQKLIQQGALDHLPETLNARQLLANCFSANALGLKNKSAGMRAHLRQVLSGHRVNKIDLDQLKMALEDLPSHDTGSQAVVIEDVAAHREQLLQQVSHTLEVDEALALQLLVAYQWNETRAVHEYVSDPTGVAQKLGRTLPIASATNAAPSKKLPSHQSEDCIVCFESVSRSMSSVIRMPCGHVTCNTCWKGVLKASLDSGDVINVRCPSPGCGCLLPKTAPKKLLSKSQFQKFQRLSNVKFVDSNPQMKWCPRPNCHRSITLSAAYGSEAEGSSERGLGMTSSSASGRVGLAVQCSCGHRFCWFCGQSGHEPASCKQASEWSQVVREVRDEADKKGEDWVKQHTQACPSCNAPIQKNDGCNHMTCASCRHEFCWVCLDPWSSHSQSTGGFYKCYLKQPSPPPTQHERQQHSNRRVHDFRDDIIYTAPSMSPSSVMSFMTSLVGKLSAVSTEMRLSRYRRFYAQHDVAADNVQQQKNHMQLLMQLLGRTPDPPSDTQAPPRPAQSKSRGPSRSPRTPRHPPPSPQEAVLNSLVEELLACHEVLRHSYVMLYYMKDSTKKQCFRELQGSLKAHTHVLDTVLNQLPYREQQVPLDSQPVRRNRWSLLLHWLSWLYSDATSAFDSLAVLPAGVLLSQLCYCYVVQSSQELVGEYIDAAVRERARIVIGARKGLFLDSSSVTLGGSASIPANRSSNSPWGWLWG